MSLKLTMDGAAFDLDIVNLRPELGVEIDGQESVVIDHGTRDGVRTVVIDGRQFEFRQARDGNRVFLRLGGRNWVIDLVDPRDAALEGGSAADEIRAPMPGAIISLHKEVGATVKHGETVLTIESMKLQTNLVSPRDGIIASLLKSVDETFEKDEVIATLETEASDA
ncbi:biotin/lipoyl-containing protein [Nitratireductor sp. XY-223]|uniref:acetyl-CoA carboxylase biotin carboxyl carrier protein subunit n=1 Tax=Nitratireductor sp. XY-223 TaxID=2561926 RepID=UPI0010AAD3C6|nr:biotin/lipoyl-containing protein [Nitratireductor sp. XY-223]